jgi:aminoglycoside 6'-N-acetyltransferase I
MSIRQARESDRLELAEMRSLLWPDSSLDQQLREVDAVLSTGISGTLPGAILVSHGEDGMLTGFLEVDQRSHADGCDPAQPVGYVEGWYVREGFRGIGVGRALMSAAEEWARAQRCVEMASDVLIENEGSLRAHDALGFEVVDRCVHLRKRLA